VTHIYVIFTYDNSLIARTELKGTVNMKNDIGAYARIAVKSVNTDFVSSLRQQNQGL